jgi:phosphosulfolactate synthase
MNVDQRLFDFLELAPRSSKPRKQGLTNIADEGDPVSWVRDMLDTWGEYVDSVKFTAALLMVPTRVMEQRIKIYRDHGLSIALADPIFAIAYYQGKAEQYLRAARDMGFTHCQIDTRQVKLLDSDWVRRADEDEMRLVGLARELGLALWGEVGQKHEEGDKARGEGGTLDGTGIIQEMKRLLSLGCEAVFLENRVVRHAIGDYGEKEGGTEQIRQIVAEVGLENIHIEIANQMSPESRNCHRLWAVRTFGPDVNFTGGTTLKDVRFVEAIRRGIIFVPGPSKASSRLWVNSLAKNRGKAAERWWEEDYPIDVAAASKLR